jgi:microcystin-dependent protein
MDPFVAEIRVFPFTFAPRGWAFCNGQLLPLSQNTALFSLLGTTYGGNGQTTFGLPDLQGRTAMHPGQGQGLSLRDLGESGGVETVTLLQSEMPIHTHGLTACDADATDDVPTGLLPAKGQFDDGTTFGPIGGYSATAPNTNMSPSALTLSGGGQPHANMQPYLTLNYCIALVGVYPPRT